MRPPAHSMQYIIDRTREVAHERGFDMNCIYRNGTITIHPKGEHYICSEMQMRHSSRGWRFDVICKGKTRCPSMVRVERAITKLMEFAESNPTSPPDRLR